MHAVQRSQGPQVQRGGGVAGRPSFITPGNKTGTGYVSDHNLADAPLSLFVDPVNGDFRLRADADDAIDAGSTQVPHLGSTTGAPDLGAFERGDDDWISTVGRGEPIHQRPTDLVARARSDGTVHLTWTDHTGGTARYFIDRGYKTDHPNNGWEFLTVGSVPAAGTTAFVDQVAGGLQTNYYRVRAQYSTFSPWATTAAGSIPSDTIADAAVELDDLRLRISDTPVVWLSAVDDQLVEGGDDGLLRIACSHPPTTDLPIRLALAASATADLDDLLILDAADQTVQLTDLRIPAGSNRLDLYLRAIVDGLAEGSETLIFDLVADAGYRRDPDLVKQQASVHISDADAAGVSRRIRLLVQPLAEAIQIRAIRTGDLRDHDGSSNAVFAGLEADVRQTFEFLVFDPLGDG